MILLCLSGFIGGIEHFFADIGLLATCVVVALGLTFVLWLLQNFNPC